MSSAVKRQSEDQTVEESAKRAKKLTSLEEEFKCTICQELIYQPSTLDCGHSFCLACVHNLTDYNCPNCRNRFQAHPKKYQKNLLMEKMIENIGGQEYETFCQERELKKMVSRVSNKFWASKLFKLIERQIDQELKDIDSISLSDLKQKLEAIFGSKYEFAILGVLAYSYICIGDQIIGKSVDRLINYFKKKSDLTNDQVIFLIKQYYFNPGSNKSFIDFMKLLKYYQSGDSNIINIIDIKLDEMIKNNKMESYKELEQMIDLYSSGTNDEDNSE